MSLGWKPLSLADVAALTRLVNLVAAADGTGRPVAQDAVAEEFTAPRFDPVRDTLGVWDGERLIAAGSTWAIPEPVDGRAMVRVRGDVHPDRRGRGIGRELLARLERRAAELGAQRHPGLRVRLRTTGGTEGSATQRLLEHAGYVADNHFVTMEADLTTWQPPPEPADVVPLDDELLRASRDAHNDAFRDHRNASDIPADDWAHWMASPSSRPGLGRVVLGAERRVLAYTIVSEHQPGVAHVELVGTRREARGRGLGRAVLAGTMTAAREHGMQVAELEVDSASPTGADRLYDSVGFVPVRTISRYQRDL